jgi:hypothetical protein
MSKWVSLTESTETSVITEEEYSNPIVPFKSEVKKIYTVKTKPYNNETLHLKLNQLALKPQSFIVLTLTFLMKQLSKYFMPVYARILDSDTRDTLIAIAAEKKINFVIDKEDEQEIVIKFDFADKLKLATSIINFIHNLGPTDKFDEPTQEVIMNYLFQTSYKNNFYANAIKQQAFAETLSVSSSLKKN